MSQHQHTEGASALPIARAFVAQGGRLLINPRGELEAGGSFAWMTADDPRAARRSFTMCRRFYRRLRDPRFARLDEGACDTRRRADGERMACRERLKVRPECPQIRAPWPKR
jgi:hypothetical protein